MSNNFCELDTDIKIGVVKHLRGLVDGSIEPKYRKYGVCHELVNRFGVEVDVLVQDFFRPHLSRFRWYSSNPDYPIACHSMGCVRAFNVCMDLWDLEDEYCRRRYEFCEWLIELIVEDMMLENGYYEY